MSKSDFTKAEKAFDEGLLQMNVEDLLNQADQYSLKKRKQIPSKEIFASVLKSMEHELKKFQKEYPEKYKESGFERQDLKKLLLNPDLLTPDDWKTIKEIRIRIEAFKREITAKLPIISNEEIVQQERISQQKARFNVNKKWLPLK